VDGLPRFEPLPKVSLVNGQKLLGFNPVKSMPTQIGQGQEYGRHQVLHGNPSTIPRAADAYAPYSPQYNFGFACGSFQYGRVVTYFSLASNRSFRNSFSVSCIFARILLAVVGPTP